MSSVHTIAIPVHSNSTSLGTGPSLNAFRKISQHEFLCGVVHNIYGEWLNILSFLYNYSNYLQIWKDASVCVAYFTWYSPRMGYFCWVESFPPRISSPWSWQNYVGWGSTPCFICDVADPEWKKGVREEIGRREARKAGIILNIFLSHTLKHFLLSQTTDLILNLKIAQKMPAVNHTNSVAFMLPFHS